MFTLPWPSNPHKASRLSKVSKDHCLVDFRMTSPLQSSGYVANSHFETNPTYTLNTCHVMLMFQTISWAKTTHTHTHTHLLPASLDMTRMSELRGGHAVRKSGLLFGLASKCHFDLNNRHSCGHLLIPLSQNVIILLSLRCSDMFRPQTTMFRPRGSHPDPFSEACRCHGGKPQHHFEPWT